MNHSLRNKEDSQVYGDSTFKTGLDHGSSPPLNSARQTINSAGHNLPPPATASNFVEELLKLPNVVNYVALRETFLSEAPFVKRSNRPFWKKWIDSKQYVNVLAASLRIISDCITDNGVIYADKLFQSPLETKKMMNTVLGRMSDFGGGEGGGGGGGGSNGGGGGVSEPIPHRSTLFLSRATMIRGGGISNAANPSSAQMFQQSFQQWLTTIDVQSLLMEKISVNIAEMLMMDRNKRTVSGTHDLLFYRLPELLAYMTLQSLLSTIPKLARVFNSIKFRELMLDWFTELINGIKITNSHHDREWIFKNTSDNPIILLNEPVQLSKSVRKMQAEALLASGGKGVRKNHKGSLKLPPIASATGTNSANSTRNVSPGVAFKNGNPASFSPNGTAGNRLANPHSADSYDSMGDLNQTKNNNSNATDTMSVSSSSTSSLFPTNLSHSRYGAARSTLVLQNSPLVQLFMNLGKRPEDNTNNNNSTLNSEEGIRSMQTSSHVCQHPLKLTLSHLPNRPIISMQSNVVQLEGKFREKKMNRAYLMKSLKESQQKRQAILQRKENNIYSMRYDIHKMNHAYKIQLAILDKKPVTQKELLAAATALESIKLTSTGNSLANLVTSSNSVGGGGGGGGGGNSVGGDASSQGHSVVTEL